ncbi:MAG: peptidoglycan DD-metalloendopeptidase family protein [Proteobacteria bacterium]|nr:peptidoglycan DD-metalloendopeptidase family protein [Pseudomonadota bacterium]
MKDALPGVGAPPDPARTRARDAATAAKQLEAFFLRRLLSESRPAGTGVDGGFAGDTFKGMFDEAIADKMSGAGGVGMAQMFAKQLGGDGTALPGLAAPHDVPLGAQPSSELGPELADLPGAPRLQMPVVGRASSGYGMRNDQIKHAMINHPGFDLAATQGTPVSAAAPGTVTHAGPAGTYGNLVIIKHPSGYETRYAHLSAVDVAVGAKVEAGDHVGKVGTTGYSTGPHLHFELRHDGKPIDPEPLLPIHGAGETPLNRSRSRPNR